ncbi:ubiquinol-cytochrome c reductase iron-sulfur subunit [Planococcus lenghuensis]|uniref:Menaquinol:cytochrome c reductase iron-sulfur subunit n=1 Tax=Planococcus lenghuensis TaxID=2213202 RepID=A0A1Q2KZJ0_9BACL|nr:ubiquinol-cytochrome c reductase iron-sulfur subunit [Planococcus lenghuensis]AQQ53618.1 menaquinol-cytochrome C reductase [Planococcus lenghuensis]
MSNNRVSRRQFLSYTIMGVGGFMASSMLMPMVRFAVDPVLQVSADGDYVVTDQLASELSEVPIRVSFTYTQEDAWYTSEVTNDAWVYLEGEEIVALSPVCKHLGCTVTWEGSADFPEQFFCPCHAGRYYKNGENVAGTPPLGPLDQFLVEVRDGYVALGPLRPNFLVS